MNRSGFKWLVVSGFCLIAAAAQALTPEQLVEKMTMSARNLSYKGLFTYERGQQASSYRIVHLADGIVEKQRLVFLDGPAMEIINNGHSLKCLHSGDADVQHIGLMGGEKLGFNPADMGEKALSSVWQNYVATHGGSARVAGRATTRIQLNPKDHHRYPFVFFVDDETGLMLKMLVLDSQGQLLERFHFVQVEIGSVTEQDLAPEISGYVEVEHSPADQAGSSSNSDSGWRLAWIPDGFRQEKTRMKPLSPQARGQQVYMYADGLSAFSVFVEPAPADALNDTSTQTGSTAAVSHVVKIRGGRFLVTVVGEIPIMTAKQIALSVEPSS